MQKRTLAVHDISCVGKCSLTVALPILSAVDFTLAALRRTKAAGTQWNCGVDFENCLAEFIGDLA